MNSNHKNLISVFSFITHLLTRPRSLLAVVTFIAWLLISLGFYFFQPEQDDTKPKSAIAKFWHEYGWQYGESEYLYSVHFTNNQQGRVVGSAGTILATHDGGEFWSKQNSNTDISLNSIHFINNQQGWIVGNDGTVLTTQNGGESWSKQNSNTNEWLESIHFIDSQQGWIVGEEGTILATQDSGENWIRREFSSAKLPEWYWFFSALCAVVFLLGLLGIRPPSRSDAISAMLSSDRPRRGNESDALESKKLAWALSRFLRHKRTEPPLTLAINAAWGGGKSSLMNWLREDLQRFGYRPVWFNAWHYEKQEQMFPALLETIRQQALPSWSSRANVKFRGKLLWQRIKMHPWLSGLLFILICFPSGYFYANPNITWTSIKTQAQSNLEQIFPKRHATESVKAENTKTDDITVNTSPLKPRDKPIFKESKITNDEIKPEPVTKSTSDTLTLLLTLFPGLAPIFGLWKGLQGFQTAGNWLSRWLNPTEQSKATLETAYRAQFARDFQAVTGALNHTLIIFIDDLDRCQPDSVCEVMETVNFLASEGSCYIVLGVWREGVERAIGLGFAEAAQEFSQISDLQIESENPAQARNKRNSGKQDEAEIRRRYGQLYLEKLINIWVSVPTLEITAAQNMLKREQNLPLHPAATATMVSKIQSFLQSGFRNWRERLISVFKQFSKVSTTQALKVKHDLFYWVRKLSFLWQFFVRLAGIFLLGLLSMVILMFSGTGIVTEDFYSSLIENASLLVGRIVAALFIVLLHGFVLKWIFRGIQFTILSRLPEKPLSQIWLSNSLILAAIALAGMYAFNSGQSWINPPTTQQKVTLNFQSDAQNAGSQTEGVIDQDTAPVSDINQEIISSELQKSEPSTAKIITPAEFDWFMVILVGISSLIWIEWLRFRLELPDDSPAFEESLLFWSPVLAKRFDTPRRLKRFINYLRFNAMRLRTLEKADMTRWEQFWNRYIRGEQPDPVREDEMEGKESSLLLLCVLEACCGANFKLKTMLVNSGNGDNSTKTVKAFQSGWENALTIDAQLIEENGESWANELRRLLIERLKYYECNAMPQPTLADLRQFEASAPARITPASVRTAGLSEQAIAWDQAIERRLKERRTANIDTSRFTADRRSRFDRRISKPASSVA